VTKNRFTMAAFSVFVLTGQAVQTDWAATPPIFN
jgi:hypothetical protein